MLYAKPLLLNSPQCVQMQRRQLPTILRVRQERKLLEYIYYALVCGRV
jgi:hypothetical protein